MSLLGCLLDCSPDLPLTVQVEQPHVRVCSMASATSANGRETWHGLGMMTCRKRDLVPASEFLESCFFCRGGAYSAFVSRTMFLTSKIGLLCGKTGFPSFIARLTLCVRNASTILGKGARRRNSGVKTRRDIDWELGCG